MLVAVIMVFVIFSFTGVAVLDLSTNSSIAALETVDNIKLQYEVESAVNEALWLINTDADSLVNSDVDGITTAWNDSTQVLSVSVDKFHMESEILLDLSEDTHFAHGIATQEGIDLSGYDPGLDDAHQVRSNFKSLPEVDLQYFIDNANTIYTQTNYLWSERTFPAGIHVFTGNNITLRDITLNEGTLVFTGNNVNIDGDCQIIAPAADENGASPAMIFTNVELLMMDSPDAIILGAIYSTEAIDLQSGTISGPIIARTVSMSNDFDFLDTEYDEYYQWTHGFGDRDNYDGPKQIDRWKVNKWIKKNLQA